MENTNISGPYQPIQCRSGWVQKINVVTPRTIIEDMNVYTSYLKWVGHKRTMAKYNYHTQVMMGEIDDPGGIEEQYSNPLTTAGFFGACGFVDIAMDMIKDVFRYSRHGLSERYSDDCRFYISACITQLVFALAADDEALAVAAKHKRTGYIGHPTELDKSRTLEMKRYFRKIAHRSEDFEKLIQSNKFDVPLMHQTTKVVNGKIVYGWQEPIEVVSYPFEEDCL